jgi:DNA gyrase subunit A
MRTPVAEIRETGRNASGVRLIRIDEGDRLVAMARVDAEEKVEGGEAEGEAPPAGDGAPPPTTASADGDGQATPPAGENPPLPDES